MKFPIYLDNAATTALAPEVLEAMMPYLTESFGNPSSTYSYGRTTRVAVENARKSVAKLLGVKASSIFFTSGGTESNNTAILSALRDLGCTSIITSPIEHHAVLHTAEHYGKECAVPVSLVKLTADGCVDYADLESLLSQHHALGQKSLVSLMYANNEVGSLLDAAVVGQLCKTYGAIFHSDCVQAVGHYPINLSETNIHFISGAGHKFHGPKGVGILYIHPSVQIQPLIHGGSQERNMRAGTENVYGIIGFAKALEIAMSCYEKDSQYIRELKSHMRSSLEKLVDGVKFNGPCTDALYTVLSVCFPLSAATENLLTDLDQAGICVSGGSACSSSSGGSHVIRAMGAGQGCSTIRFSFSKYNTVEEIDHVVGYLAKVIAAEKEGATV